MTIHPPFWPLLRLSTTFATTPLPRRMRIAVPTNSARYGFIFSSGLSFNDPSKESSSEAVGGGHSGPSFIVRIHRLQGESIAQRWTDGDIFCDRNRQADPDREVVQSVAAA